MRRGRTFSEDGRAQQTRLSQEEGEECERLARLSTVHDVTLMFL